MYSKKGERGKCAENARIYLAVQVHCAGDPPPPPLGPLPPPFVPGNITLAIVPLVAFDTVPRIRTRRATPRMTERPQLTYSANSAPAAAKRRAKLCYCKAYGLTSLVVFEPILRMVAVYNNPRTRVNLVDCANYVRATFS